MLFSCVIGECTGELCVKRVHGSYCSVAVFDSGLEYFVVAEEDV